MKPADLDKKDKSGDTKIRTRSSVNTPIMASGHDAGQSDKEGDKEKEKVGEEKQQLEQHIADTAVSLKKLESLFSKLEGRMRNLKSDLESKFEKFAKAHEKRLKHLEGTQQELCKDIQDHRKLMAVQDDKIEKLECAIRNNDLDPLKKLISDLQDQVRDQEERISNLQNSESPELPEFYEKVQKLLIDQAKRIDYHESKLTGHDKHFLDVYTDLRDKNLVIEGIYETPGENLAEKVINNINSTLRAASPNAVQISNVDIDMIYRTGKFNAYAKYPRPITVCFVRKGLKQHILNTKKGMGWDPDRKIAYLDDLTYDVRNHRENLKTIAAKAQDLNFVTKMAGNRITIDGVSYAFDDMDIIPDELKSAIPMIKKVKNGIAFRGKDCYLSNFFPANV